MKTITVKDIGVLVYIPDVPGFRDWLVGQTMPLVEGHEEPYGWAYMHDYERFIRNKPVID